MNNLVRYVIWRIFFVVVVSLRNSMSKSEVGDVDF